MSEQNNNEETGGRVNANVISCHEVAGWSVNVSKGTFFLFPFLFFLFLLMG